MTDETHDAVKRRLADMIEKLTVLMEKIRHHAHDEEDGELFPEVEATEATMDEDKPRWATSCPRCSSRCSSARRGETSVRDQARHRAARLIAPDRRDRVDTRRKNRGDETDAVPVELLSSSGYQRSPPRPPPRPPRPPRRPPLSP
jgi:hypothetical protein